MANLAGSSVGYDHEESDFQYTPPIIGTQDSSIPREGAPNVDQSSIWAAVFKFWFTKGPMDSNKVSIVQCHFCSSKYKHPQEHAPGEIRIGAGANATYEAWA